MPRLTPFVGLVFALGLVSGAAADEPLDFTLRSATSDDVFQLAKHRDQMIVLHFLLKTECPFCLKHTHDYAVLAKKTPEVVHLFLKPDTAEEIKAWAGNIDRADLKSAPTIYRDPNAELAKKFKVPDGYKFHGQTVHYPALIVIDGNGRELFRHVGKNNGDRLSVKEFIAKQAEIQANLAPGK